MKVQIMHRSCKILFTTLCLFFLAKNAIINSNINEKSNIETRCYKWWRDFPRSRFNFLISMDIMPCTHHQHIVHHSNVVSSSVQLFLQCSGEFNWPYFRFFKMEKVNKAHHQYVYIVSWTHARRTSWWDQMVFSRNWMNFRK